jgi:hypothetical protein
VVSLSGNGGQLLSGAAPRLAVLLGEGAGEDGIGGGGVAATGVVPARDHLDAARGQDAAVAVGLDGGAVAAEGRPGAAGGAQARKVVD